MTLPYDGMTAVLYARVSSEDEADGSNRQNADSQILALVNYCKDNKIEILGKYVDRQTGANADRPLLDMMLGRIMRGGVQILLTLDTDRLSRRMEDTNDIIKKIKPFGTVIRYLKDSTAPETEEGYLINNVKAYGAQAYSTGHTLKIKAGLARARAEGTKSGKAIGRPAAVIDMDLVMECADKRLSINEAAKIMKVGGETLRCRLIKTGRITEYYRRLQAVGGCCSNRGIVDKAADRYLSGVLSDRYQSPKTQIPETTTSLYSPTEKTGGAL